MQDFDWKKEREKYRAKLDEPTPVKTAVPVSPAASEPQKSAAMQIIEAEENRRQKRRIAVVITVIVLIIAIGAGGVWYFTQKKSSGSASSAAGENVADNKALPEQSGNFAAIAEKYKHAVGAVAVRYELADGSNFVNPIGTAWAFAEDKFATNAHVANGIKNSRIQMIKQAAKLLLNEELKKSGCKDVQAYEKKFGKSKCDQLVTTCIKQADSAIVKVEAMILINGERHKSLPISAVAIHRDYGSSNKSYKPDFAVLTINGKHDCYFKLAPKEVLYELKAGDPVAFLGFPMEGVGHNDKNNINVESPVATMQIGNITSVSGFDNEDAGKKGNQHIQHNLPLAGGASGSPIFNARGEVVAILWGMSVIQQGNGDRAPNPAGINFGTRVDLISGVGEPVAIQSFILKLK